MKLPFINKIFNYNVIVYDRVDILVEPKGLNKIPVYKQGWDMDHDGQEHTIYKVKVKELSDIVMLEEGKYLSPTFVNQYNIVDGWKRIKYDPKTGKKEPYDEL